MDPKPLLGFPAGADENGPNRHAVGTGIGGHAPNHGLETGKKRQYPSTSTVEVQTAAMDQPAGSSQPSKDQRNSKKLAKREADFRYRNRKKEEREGLERRVHELTEENEVLKNQIGSSKQAADRSTKDLEKIKEDMCQLKDMQEGLTATVTEMCKKVVTTRQPVENPSNFGGSQSPSCIMITQEEFQQQQMRIDKITMILSQMIQNNPFNQQPGLLAQLTSQQQAGRTAQQPIPPPLAPPSQPPHSFQSDLQLQQPFPGQLSSPSQLGPPSQLAYPLQPIPPQMLQQGQSSQQQSHETQFAQSQLMPHHDHFFLTHPWTIPSCQFPFLSQPQPSATHVFRPESTGPQSEQVYHSHISDDIQ